jgi:hypothetical protein
MTIVEQAAYLKGLTEGLGCEPDSKEGKLWNALTALLSDMAHEIEDLQANSLDMADAIDDIGDELSYLEELTLDLDRPEDFEDFEPFEDDGELEDDEAYSAGPHLFEDEDSDEGGDEELRYDGVLYDVTCPSCGQEISFDEETLEAGSITCPGCGEILEFDLSDEEE